MGYIVKRITKKSQFTPALARYIYEAGIKTNAMYGNKFPGWERFKVINFIHHHCLWVCYVDGRIVGFLAAIHCQTFFSPEQTLLRQELLYAEPRTRAALLLLKEFIDYGKRHADHVITMIGAKTNIKRRSLERLGFTLLEELYRLEK